MLTWDEFLKLNIISNSTEKFILSGIECPKCKRELYKDIDKVYKTHFVKNRYVCLHHSCNFEDIA